MDARPYVIWFWFLNDVEPEEITRELEEMASIGIGGVEVRIIDDGRFERASFPPVRRMAYLSDEWLDVFAHVCAEAERLGMKVSTNLGMGWRYGGPWITKEHQSKRMACAYAVLRGPTTWDEALAWPDEDISPDDITCVQALAWRVADRCARAVDPASFRDLTPLMETRRHADGPPYRLRWDVPEGHWLIGTFVVYARGGPDHVRDDSGGGGRSFDPFSADAAAVHLEAVLGRIKDRAGRYFGTTLTEIATDSWEYGETRINWSPEIPRAFPAIAGYDLVPRMHVFVDYGPDKEEILGRDLPAVESDLLVNGFFRTITLWCRENDLWHRPQAYGRPEKDLFDAYFWSDIPEVENPRGPREAAWVAHTCGKPIVSSEALTFLRGSGATMEGARKRINQFLAGGVNRIDFHSWSYSPPEAGVPGWRMYAPFHINRTVAWFPYAGHLCSWITRSQWLLQAGCPVAEAVVYGWPDVTPYPVDAVNATTFRHLRKPAEPASSDFKYLVLAEDAERLTIDELARVSALIEAGVTVLCEVPPTGWPVLARSGNASDSDVARLAVLFDEYERLGKVLTVESPMEYVARDATVTCESESIRYLHRRVEGAEVYFVLNSDEEKAIRTDLHLRHAGLVPEIWDADTGATFQLGVYCTAGDSVVVPVELGPLEHCFYVLSDQPERLHAIRTDADALARDGAGNLYAVMSASGEYSVELSDGRTLKLHADIPPAVEVQGPWRVCAEASKGHGLEGPSSRVLTVEELVSWTELEGLERYLGVATYEAGFDVPDELLADGLQLLLDLGDVRQVAQVWVNDRPAGTAWRSPYGVDVTRLLRPGGNRLRVDCANLEYFLEEGTPSGLLGPVLIRCSARVPLAP